jgi:hypothetical protein
MPLRKGALKPNITYKNCISGDRVKQNFFKANKWLRKAAG